MLALRPYQEDIVSRVQVEFIKGFKRVLSVLPTGGGKTVIFTYIAKKARDRGSRTIILVHRDFLIRQTSKKLAELGIPHGIISGKNPMTSDLIQVASVDTLVRRLDRLKIKPTFIVCDEAHHIVAAKWARIVDAFPAAFVLGFTATPERTDGTGLGLMFESMVVGHTVRQLTEDGWLVPSIVYAPPLPVDFSRVRKARNGDYADEALEEILDDRTVTGCAVSHYKAICPDVPAVAFCTTVLHSMHVASQFVSAGIPAATIHGGLPKQEQERLLADFAAGRIKILASCELISEGFDLPSVGAVILLRPTLSLALYLQQIGRCLRPDEGKIAAYILDHVGNCFKHGLPDEDRDWTLAGSKSTKCKFEKTPPIRQCAKCFAVFAPSPACPLCGHEVQIKKRESSLEVVEGELKPVDEVNTKRANTVQEIRRRAADCTTLEQLQALGRELKYKPGWALAYWKARQAKQEKRRAI